MSTIQYGCGIVEKDGIVDIGTAPTDCPLLKQIDNLMGYRLKAQARIQELEALVREMVTKATTLLENPYYRIGWIKRTEDLAEVIKRPLVRAIMEGK